MNLRRAANSKENKGGGERKPEPLLPDAGRERMKV